MVGQKKTFIFIKYIGLIIAAAITLIPIILAIMGGMKSLAQLRLNFIGIPKPFAWQNYIEVLSPIKSTFFLNLINSTIVMIFTVLLALIFSALAGYALSRLKFKGSIIIYNYFLLGLLFPVAVAILPLYIELKTLRLLDNYFGLIIVQVAFSMPWNVMLTRGFFMQIPQAIEEAAVIDGCGKFRIFLQIILPLSTPVLATIATLTMVSSWNNFFLPLLIFNSENLYTLPMGVMQFQGQYLYQYNLVFTYITLAIIPAVIFFILAQKYIIAAFSGASIKG